MTARKLAAAQSHQAVRRKGEHHTTACLGRGARHGGGGSGAAAAPPLPAPTCQACSEMCWPSAPASRGWGRGSAPWLGTCQAVPPLPRSPAAPPIMTTPLSALPAPRTCSGDLPVPPGPPCIPGSAWPVQTYCETPLGKRGDSMIPVLVQILRLQSSPTLPIASPFMARFGVAPPRFTTTKAHPPDHHHRGPTAGACPQGHSAVGEPARAKTEPCHS